LIDTEYVGQFLLTYRSFALPERVLQKLVEKFNVSPPANATFEQTEEFKKTQSIIRNRVINVVKTWLGKKHSYDIEHAFCDNIEEFINVVKVAGLEKQHSLLKDVLEKHVKKSKFTFIYFLRNSIK
jgi:hypothetical protein